MKHEVNDSLNDLLDNWEHMQLSDLDSIDIDADRFGESFYNFIEHVRRWILTIDNKPNLEDALQMPEISEIFERIPRPLHLNFETELDDMLNGLERSEDTSYFG